MGASSSSRAGSASDEKGTALASIAPIESEKVALTGDKIVDQAAVRRLEATVRDLSAELKLMEEKC